MTYVWYSLSVFDLRVVLSERLGGLLSSDDDDLLFFVAMSSVTWD